VAQETSLPPMSKFVPIATSSALPHPAFAFDIFDHEFPIPASGQGDVTCEPLGMICQVSGTVLKESSYDPVRDLKTNCNILISLLPTVIFWVAVPSFSCQASIV